MPKTRKISFVAAGLAAAAPAAHAAISYTDLADTTLAPGEGMYFLIDFDTGAIAKAFDTAGYGSSDAYFYFFFGASEYPRARSRNNWTVGQDGGFAARYSRGDDLTFGTTGTGVYLEVNGAGPWEGSSGQHMLAFRNTGDAREVWLKVNYNDAANNITFKSFAIGTGVDNLRAAVPEPAETAAVMALLAGSAAFWHRRRKLRAA